MFPKLFKTKKFIKDLELWKSKINSLEDPKAKAKGQRLLSQYTNHARQIDAGHDISYSRNLDPEKLRENVVSLQNFRNRIEKFVKDIDR